MSQLFRQQALDFVASPYGEVQAWSHLKLWPWLTAMGCLLVLLLAVMLQLRYAPKLALAGVTQAANPPLAIVSRQGGMVRQLNVAVGQEVSAEDVLVTLSKGHYGSTGQTQLEYQTQKLTDQLWRLDQTIQQQVRVDDHKRHALERDRSALQESLLHLQKRLPLTVHMHALAQQQWQRVSRVAEQGWVSRDQADKVQQQSLHQRLELVALRGRIDEQKTAIAKADDALAVWRAQARLEMERLQHQRAEILAAIENLQLDAGEVVMAETAGVVADVLDRAGEVVAAGTPLLTLADAAVADTVEVWVPTAGISKVFVGQKVRVRFAGWPFAEHGAASGVVREVALQTRLLKLNTAPAYRLRIALLDIPPTIQGLRSGMRAQVDLLLDRHPLWHWLLRPLHEAWSRL